MSKGEIRAEAIAARRAIPREELILESGLVQKKVLAQKEYRSAKLVASYVSKQDEVQTDWLVAKMISSGKRVAVPLVDGPSGNLLFFEIRSLDDLSPGTFGILEPARVGPEVPLDRTDLILVPLVAWDGRGHRIGYGRGFFDRALAARGRSVAVGLALESQRVPKIPDGPSDVRLDMIVTEERVVRFNRRAE